MKKAGKFLTALMGLALLTYLAGMSAEYLGAVDLSRNLDHIDQSLDALTYPLFVFRLAVFGFFIWSARSIVARQFRGDDGLTTDELSYLTFKFRRGVSILYLGFEMMYWISFA